MIENELQSVILGLKSHVQSVREESKKSLERLMKEVTFSGQREHDIPPDVLLKSAKFSFVIYNEMKQIKDLDRIRQFFITLLSIGGRGPFFAWKFFAHGNINQNILIDIIRKFPVHLRLRFVYHYALDDISVRRYFGSMVKLLLKDIIDRDTVILFLSYVYDQNALLDYVFDDLCIKLKIQEMVIQKELKDDNPEEKIKGIKAIGALGKITGYHSCVKLLLQDKHPSVHIACLEMLAKSKVIDDQIIINAISHHLNNKDSDIAVLAFKSFLSLKAPGLEEIVRRLSHDVRLKLFEDYEWLSDLEWTELNTILNVLSPQQSRNARAEIINRITRNNPEKMIFFLRHCVKSVDGNIRKECEELLQKIDSIMEKEKEEVSKDDIPERMLPSKKSKSFFEKITWERSNKNLKKLLKSKSAQGEDFQEEVFSDIDLSGSNLREVNFDGAVFSNVDFSSAKLYSVTFNGAHLENVKMENTVVDFASFNNTVFKNVSFTNSSFNMCDFTNSWMYNSSFDSANLRFSLFSNARIKKTTFSHTNLTDTSFVGSDLTFATFNSANLHLSDFSLVKGRLCEFYGVDFSTVAMEQASLNIPPTEFNEIVIPDELCNKDIIDVEGFKFLLLSVEMEKQCEAFLEYNRCRTELALDTLSPEQGDLFELVPLLIHSSLELLPENNPVRNAPTGIFDYFSYAKSLQRAKKYFNIDETQPILDKDQCIEGLFSIGSTGTIAQSSGSDIDYWVCVEENKLGEEKIKLLNAKLRAIEEWAFKKFNSELHFFVVDLASVREDRYGGSDIESSGSAQGKILKEEFYRTMIHIAGKIPLWCVIPPWIDDRDYQYFLSLSSQTKKNYLDLGHISAIPKGEYFGATIWQIFKSLKSPYKSVIKMSLLEKYIQEEEKDSLLCDRLKAVWSDRRYDMIHQDPYLLLFGEVSEYYQKTEQKDVVHLLLICFFLKLGFRSIDDLDKSVLGIRKRLVQDFMKGWSWSRIKVLDLGNFNEWSFDKIFWLGTLINNYMIRTYKKLSHSLQKTATGDTIITPQDTAILGRRMFVQFSKQPTKVEKLPFVVHRDTIFKQLYLQYNQDEKGHAAWNLKKAGIKKQSVDEILKKMDRIEEIAIWLVYNSLYSPSTLFTLMPNPTPISLQDILNLLREVYEFFPFKGVEDISPRALLEEKRVNKLFVALNFNLSRKLKIINEYTAIYKTSWGEYFCKVFVAKEGFRSVDDVLSYVKKQFNFTLPTDQIGVYIPHSAKKYL